MKKIILIMCATVLLSGCPWGGTKKGSPKIVDAPIICPAAARINLKSYELKALTSKDDTEFHLWAADMAAKYPNLKNAYKALYDCVKRRHPDF